MTDHRRAHSKDDRRSVGADAQRGRACYDEGRWEDAFEALSRARGQGEIQPADLERLAWSAALTGRDPAFLEALEALYRARCDQGDRSGAARAAFWLGFRLSQLGEPGRAGAWLSRARRSVDCADGDCAERGYLLIPAAHRELMQGNLDAARDLAVQAADIGAEHAEPDLVALARHLQGRAALQRGEVDEGLGLLDEVMLSASSRELSPVVTGLVYCSVISACQRVHALDRAREWTAVLADWCEGQPQLVTFTGSCLVHRAEIMQLGGAWGEAITEARRAAARFEGALDPEAVADAYYQQGEIHRLRGELAAAEEAYRHASRFGREPQPGLALLRLAEGHPGAAAAAIRRVLGALSDPLERARYLPAAVEIFLAAGTLDGARSAAEELGELAKRFETDVLGAMAAHACGAVLLAEGRAQEAEERLRRAFRGWQQVGAPYIAARIRVLLAKACRDLGDPDGGQLELDAAMRVLEQLGAAPAVAGVERGGSARDPSSTHGLTGRELEVLRWVAKGETNAAIAAELCLSVKTIDRHVSNIFTKLDVSSRAAATAFAYRNGLI